MRYTQIKRQTDDSFVGTYARYPVCFSHGRGMKLYDTEGNEYLDFLAGIAVNALGYADPDTLEAEIRQLKKLSHTSNLFYNESQAKFLAHLLSLSPFQKGFLCNSGAEANEGAFKTVRKYFHDRNQNKFEFITAKNSFHGRTMMTATLTGQEKYSSPFAPLPQGIRYATFNDLESFRTQVTPQTAAVLLEVIQGEGGVLPAEKSFLQGIESLCRQNDLLLVLDEVQTGMGRTGKMFAFEHYGIHPDIITLSKALGGGLPLGAFLVTQKLANVLTPGSHGTTFGGNPVACEAGDVLLSKLEGGLLERVQSVGTYFKEKLGALSRKYDFLFAPRGIGLLIGLPLSDRINGKTVVNDMLTRGIILNCAGNNTLRFAPPLIVTETEIDLLTASLDAYFSKMQ